MLFDKQRRTCGHNECTAAAPSSNLENSLLCYRRVLQMSVPNDVTSATTTLAQFCLFPSPCRSPTTVHEQRPLAAYTISTRTWHIIFPTSFRYSLLVIFLLVLLRVNVSRRRRTPRPLRGCIDKTRCSTLNICSCAKRHQKVRYAVQPCRISK